VPPLAYQIAAAGSIVLCATVFGAESISYRVRKVWKTSVPALRVGESLRLDTRMHELLGYSPRDGRDVVLFFVRGLRPTSLSKSCPSSTEPSRIRLTTSRCGRN
jgi:hypothetical protein